MLFATLAVALVLITGLVAWYLPYRRDIRAAYQRLEELESRLVETPCGAVEYAERGDGQPLLLIHGNGGGFDQGLALGADLLGEVYRGIAPSRFGYLRSPLPDSADQPMQADAFACLLDELGVDRAVVIAWSAGGMSAAQLALRHPERVAGLVLVSTGIAPSDAEQDVWLPPAAALRTVFGSDFIYWLSTKAFRSLTQRMFVPRGYQLDAADEAVVADAFRTTLPIAPRAQGAVFDTLETITEPEREPSRYPLETLTVPTLVVTAEDDPSVRHDQVLTMVDRIPDAQLLSIPTGGHLMLGHRGIVTDSIRAFIEDAVRDEQPMVTH